MNGRAFRPSPEQNGSQGDVIRETPDSQITKLRSWEPWRRLVLKRITLEGATSALKKLVEKGCSEEAILIRLAAVVATLGADPRNVDGMTEHVVKAAPDKLRSTAELVRRLNDHFPVRTKDSIDPDRLAKLLSTFADRFSEVIKAVFDTPSSYLHNLAICILVNYVDETTRKFRDKDVSALIGAVLHKRDYAAHNLDQWRNDHKKDLAVAAGSLINPCTFPLPRQATIARSERSKSR